MSYLERLKKKYSGTLGGVPTKPSKPSLHTLMIQACEGVSITPSQLKTELEAGGDIPSVESGELSETGLRLVAETLSLMRGHTFTPPETDDERRYCRQCQHLSLGGICRSDVTARGYEPLDHLPRRCAGYLPEPEEQDQRTGTQRWPSLQRNYIRNRQREIAQGKNILGITD